MATTVTQVRCPQCGNVVQTPLQQLIDVGQDASGKARLLSGRLNAIRCASCGYQGQLATPLVYHDPEKELLLTYIPVELGLPHNEQEKVLGALINRAVDRLPTEKRKGYLLQPQAVLTMQGLIERVLQEDGITREDLEAQRRQMQLFEDLIRAPEDQLEALITEHDAELNDTFFQLATLAMGSVPEERGRAGLAQRIDQILTLSSLGKRLQEQQEELRAAEESLRAAEGGLTRQALLELYVQAPSQGRVEALAGLTRPGMDYEFFQLLTERIDAAQGEEQERLSSLRQQLLEITQRIDQAQQARVAAAAQLLKALLEAPDLDAALQDALPMIDDLFLGLLEANLRAVRERGDLEGSARLQLVSDRIQEAIRQALPAGLRLAQQVLETQDEAQAEALITGSPDLVDDEFLSALMSAAQQLEARGEKDFAARLRRLHRLGLRTSMRTRLKAGDSGAGQGSSAP
jgi:hypothetical protein